MRILHVVPTYFPAVRYGGPIYSVHGLAAGQAALGHDVSVFTTNADGNGVSDVPVSTPVPMDGVAVTYFPVGSPRRLFRAPAMADALATQAGKFDIIHLHSVFLWPTAVGARAARKADIPYVLSPRGMLVGSLIRARSSIVKRAWLAFFERRTILQASAIHFTAEREEKDFEAMGLQAMHHIVIPNGVDETRPASPDRISPDVAEATAQASYALYLGRLNWKKNLVALIDALAFASGVRLIIAGTDDEAHANELRAAINAAGLQDRVALIARNIADADKEWLFAHCALFALPSLNENFGNTVLEAMVRAKPVVVSSDAGVAEVVREAGCGLIVPPTAEALGHAMQALVDDSAISTTMGQRGRQTALDCFSWHIISGRMIAAYETLSAP